MESSSSYKFIHLWREEGNGYVQQREVLIFTFRDASSGAFENLSYRTLIFKYHSDFTDWILLVTGKQ